MAGKHTTNCSTQINLPMVGGRGRGREDGERKEGRIGRKEEKGGMRSERGYGVRAARGGGGRRGGRSRKRRREERLRKEVESRGK